MSLEFAHLTLTESESGLTPDNETLTRARGMRVRLPIRTQSKVLCRILETAVTTWVTNEWRRGRE